ncbi:hypothetical protein PRK78_004595 [Emydomyces testavorans]|uniref:GATA-type domain-containing protein n=1 Tax=Emydomyces testavorans TaxID=2070801 RepID=A0AAF0IJX2_9EURO|nr:hypothetical protein PRK78_004595 [Emydomyces testavorans]
MPGHVAFPLSRREADGMGDPTKPSAGHTPRGSLPCIGFLDLGKSRKSSPHPQTHPSVVNGSHGSTTPPVSPMTGTYQTAPSQHIYSSSVPSSFPPGSGYVSSSAAHRPGESERDQYLPPQQTQAGHRQSLPSIHEALGNNPLSFQPGSSHTTAARHSLSQLSPSHNTPTSGANGAGGLSDPFSNTSSSTPLAQDHLANQHSAKPASIRSEGQRSSVASIHSQESRNPSIMSLSSGRSPTQSARTTHSQGSSYDIQGTAPTSSMSSPTAYGAYPPGHAYLPNGSQQNAAHALPSYDVKGNTPWNLNPTENVRIEPVKPGALTRGPSIPYSEPMKRQLDMFELQASWNEITEGSGRTLDFSRTHAARIYQSNRTDPTLPALSEIDDLLQIQRRNLDVLGRIRHAVLDQEHAIAQQRERMRMLQTEHPYGDDRATGYREEFKGGGFAGGDAKKRRGKPAPPGRCHSCSRSETPEWRRGPDGARTLCNACGLHYAKLTRKLGHKAAAHLRSRNGIDPRLPAHP